MGLKIVDASYHRNGVCGMGFWAVLFEDKEPGMPESCHLKIASLFEDNHYCSVYSVDLLAERNIQFGQNSWRGDQYAAELRPLLDAWVIKHKGYTEGAFA